jgi:hypothetical protein
MKKIIPFIIAAALLMACASTPNETYNSATYPDSFLIKAFENAKVDPVTFTLRATRAIQAEIAIGKFTRDDVLKFIADTREKIQVGLSYDVMVNLITHYARENMAPAGGGVSDVAVIAFYMLMPDFGPMNIPDVIGPQDRDIVVRFLDYLEKSI